MRVGDRGTVTVSDARFPQLTYGRSCCEPFEAGEYGVILIHAFDDYETGRRCIGILENAALAEKIGATLVYFSGDDFQPKQFTPDNDPGLDDDECRRVLAAKAEHRMRLAEAMR